MGLLLLGTFVLGGIIGGLAGVALGHEGRDFRGFRGRDGLEAQVGGRYGNDVGEEDGFAGQRMLLRRNVEQTVNGGDVRTQIAPVTASPSTTTRAQ